MKKFYSLTVFTLLLVLNVTAQTPASEQAYYHRQGPGTGNNTNPDESSFSGTSGTGANLDVVYHRVNWNINPIAAKAISGTVTTHFRTISPNVSVITLDLRQSAFDNVNLLVTYHGITCVKSFPATNILSITLPTPIAASNTLDSITVAYAGTPPPVAGAAQGYQRQTPALGGYNVAIGNYITTLSESYEDRDWWPCKADMQDKIDSMDIYVTVPWILPADTFWVASNGRLVDSTINGANRTFHFIHDYPIASYLVAVSVAKFDRFYRVVNIGGTNTQVAFYLLRGKTAGTITGILTAMDNVTLALTAFNSRFGDYPFKREKHGFYDGLLGAGGMEHQTFSAMAPSALSNSRTLIHELVHQWFGDNVSFASWNDLWLAEGFARYGESLAGELVPALGINAFTTRSTLRTNAINDSITSTWIPDANASTSNGQWQSNYGGTVYERGGMVISMLRTLCGDSVFFKVLKKYQTDLAGKSVTTDTLRNYFNRELGHDISEFFRDYVGGSGRGSVQTGGIGHPRYNINWGNPATTKIFRMAIQSQTQSAGSNVAYFNGPIVLHVTNAATGWTRDTTIVIYDWGGGLLSRAGRGMSAPEPYNFLEYNLSFTPTNVFFDDSMRLLARPGNMNKISLVDLTVLDFVVKANNSGNLSTLLLDGNSINTTVTLERSANGIDFSDLGTMILEATTTYKKYKFNDSDPLNGTNYYRARYKNAEGNILYSKIIKITNSRTNTFSLVNNPVSGKLKIRSMDVDGQQFGFNIYDAAGKLVYQADKLFTGSIMELDTEKLSKGSYVLSITAADDKKESLKFVIN